MISIPLKSIKRTEKTISHLKKTKATQLLKIVFSTETSTEDAVAWAIYDVDNLIKIIQERII